MTTRNRLALAAWLSLAATLYATLLPFQFLPVSFADAWEAFWQITFHPAGPGSRQQVMANVLIFMPLGFFWTGWLSQYSTGLLWRAAVVMFVAALALFTTGSVEFLQSWIPHRVPALLDISANFAGGLAGIAAWFLFGERLRGWLARTGLGGKLAVRRVLFAYVALYVIASLMPLDFVLSWRELLARFDSDLTGWWTAAAGCQDFWRCTVMRLGEVGLTIPLGIWLAVTLARNPWKAWVLAPVVGIAVEAAQLLTVTGVVEGLSAVTRASGAILGVLAVQYRRQLRAFPLEAAARPLVVLATIPYLLLLLAVNLGSQGFALETGSVMEKWEAVRWLPFYHHYFVPETRALASVTFVLVMYAPVGILAWLWAVPKRGPSGRNRGGAVIATAALLAFLMETGKLFLSGLRFDVTSLLLAGFAAWGAWSVCSWAWAQWTTANTGHTRKPVPRDAPAARPGDPGRRLPVHPTGWTLRVLGVLLLGTVAWLTLTWPTLAPWLAVGLTAYGAWLWRRPEAWLFVIPALIPTLNLSLLTGRFLLDELDLFLLATVGVLLLRWRSGLGFPRVPRGVAWAMALFTLSVVVSLGLRMTPWPGFDANAWMHYSSEWNGVRVAKGFLWAVVLFLLAGQSSVAPARLFQRWFVPGVVVGLAGVLGIVFWERLTYPGLLNLDANYRLTGFFAEMQAGGPSIEAYLVMAIPFVLLLAWQRRQWVWLVPVLGLLAAALYALVVTYSRGGYVGMAVVVAIIVLGAWAGAYTVGVRDRRRLLMLTLLPLAVGAILLPQITGTVFERRMAQIDTDFDLRVSHWQTVLDLAERGRFGNVLGSGMGSFPSAYTWGNPQGRTPGDFAFLESSGHSFLRVGSGDPLFLNQRIRIPREGTYTLELDALSDRGARLHVFVCEKHIRHSFGCRQTRLTVPGPEGADAPSTWTFSADGLETGPWFARRQLALSFTVLGRERVIDIHRISLTSPDGREVLRNGDFSQGGRHWYFTTHHLWPWRTENQWLEIWFDQGWVGLFGFLLLTLVAFWKLLKRSVSGSFEATTVLASLGGTLGVGIFSTVFWSPRLSMLFILILLLGLAAVHERGKREEPFRQGRGLEGTNQGLSATRQGR